MTDNLTETNPSTMLATLNETAISTWSDDRRKEFAGTFDARTRAARCILFFTATTILEQAQKKQFISHYHRNKLEIVDTTQSLSDKRTNAGWWNESQETCGGRSYADLREIGNERAKLVISELPPLKYAVQMIDPETAGKIDRKAKLKERGQVLVEQLEQLCEPASLEELDQNMTIGQFRAEVKARDRQKRILIAKLNAIGKEGEELENAINKKLYKGLPGLSEAVIESAQLHLDRAKALDELSRRVSERVMFGDSTEAMELLRVFEQDEQALPDTIKSSIRLALNKLKLGAKKQLTGKRS